jgi:hypothetical protein
MFAPSSAYSELVANRSIYPKGTWALVDPEFSHPDDNLGGPSGAINNSEFFTIFMSPPDKDRWRQFKFAMIRVLKPWSWQEYRFSAYASSSL